MIVNHWGPMFTKLYGHVFPESYLCIDCEYCGSNPDKDLIVEIGHVLVEDRQVVDQLNLVLDWSNHPVVPDDWVRSALRRVELSMANRGEAWRLKYEVMREEGIKPEKVLAFYHKLFQTVRKRGLPFAAHNGYFADARMLAGNFAGFLGREFAFGPNELFDTGAIVKASRCLESQDPAILKRGASTWLPQSGDTMESYFCRVTRSMAKGVFWNMGACIEYFRLAEKHVLDLSQQHIAQFDAYLVHLLMEEIRKRITRYHIVENPFASPAAMGRCFDQEMAKRGRPEDEEQLPEARPVVEPEERPDPPHKPLTRRRRQRVV